MKRLLTTTTALSIALANVQPWPVMAQTLTETGQVIAADGTVLCEPTAELACDPTLFVEQAAAIAAQMEAAAAAEAEAAAAAEAEAAAAAAAEAEAAAKAEADAAAAKAEADAAAAAAAEAEAAAKAEADAAAAAAAEAEAAAKAEADAAAAAAAEAEAAAKAEADAAAAAAEAEAVAKAEADAAAAAAAEAEAAAKAEADAAAAAEADAAGKAEADAAAEAEAAAKAEADAAAAAEAEAAAKADAAAAAEADAAAKAEADAAAAAEAEAAAKAEADAAAVEGEAVATDAVVEKTAEELAAEAAALEAAQAEIVVSEEGTVVDAAAGLKTEEVVIDPNAELVVAPEVTEAEAETLNQLMGEPAVVDPTALGAAATLTAEPVEGEPVPVAEAPVAPDAVTSTVEVLTEEDTRSSSQEFAAAPVEVEPGKKNRLSDLEKVGLFALGAMIVGSVINDSKNKKEERQVVSNTGDRVVVLNPDGTYSVYKDDDAVLRQPGATVRTETFKDGSTRTIVQKADGTQTVTIRDATGRVLRRATYDNLGREVILINDFEEEVPVVVKKLPKPKADRVTISSKDENAALKAKLAAREAAKSGRTFSLRQIREIPEVRALAATIDAGNVTFDSGSAAITATEADELADLGDLMQALLAENPAEVFLIEGHTDATGKAAMNLALSDRRAESVALALTEYFEIPPENMIVQGYGEAELLIDTQADERRNRRVAVRVITPLLRMAN